MILADKIIDLRKKNGWSQEELAEKLGVSRQAVSKWESAQAIPDLGRVLAMADLFSVTTDYLLRDENEAPTPAAVEDGASESSVRRVSMEEASAFLALCRKQAPTRALAVSLCVLSPIPLLMILSRTGEGPAAGVGSIIGVVILLLLVVAAVVIFLRQGMESKEYEYLEQEDIETAYGVSGMVKEKQAAYRETCTRGIIVGVVLAVHSVGDTRVARHAGSGQRRSPGAHHAAVRVAAAGDGRRGSVPVCLRRDGAGVVPAAAGRRRLHAGRQARGTFADCADLLVPGDGGVSGVELYHDGMGSDVDCLACRGCAVRGGSGYHPYDPQRGSEGEKSRLKNLSG